MPQALTHWLAAIGIVNQSRIFHNPNQAVLISEAIRNNEGILSDCGSIAVSTKPFTGRSPNDKFLVDYPDSSNIWWGQVNQPISPQKFTRLKHRMSAYLNNRKLYIIDCHIGADPNYKQSIRIITEFAWQALACQNLFIYAHEKHNENPDITIIAAPDFHPNPELDFTRTNTAICIDLKEKIILVAGTKYAGEIKKSAFTMMNYLLPIDDVLPMHCSANMGKENDVALFFGLSGTGKTTLSSTPERQLIGDDEHGWNENGIFNFEGGCYAKVINLKESAEPVVWQATNRFGTILENVTVDHKTRIPNYDDSQYTENTRSVYPLSAVKNAHPTCTADHPRNIFFLTADAFGVMPPVARLDHDQVRFYFLSGYTSKVAGTERYLGRKPVATFSSCFAEPFLTLQPAIYADLLQERISDHGSDVWLINTGWTGGNFNTGFRIPLFTTRRMIDWILSGEHHQAVYHRDMVFDIEVPNNIPGIDKKYLYPKMTWDNESEFITAAEILKRDFDENYRKYEKDQIPVF